MKIFKVTYYTIDYNPTGNDSEIEKLEFMVGGCFEDVVKAALARARKLRYELNGVLYMADAAEIVSVPDREG